MEVCGDCSYLQIFEGKISFFNKNDFYDEYITRVAKLRLASRMLIHFKLGYQGAWPPLIYKKADINDHIVKILVVNINKLIEQLKRNGERI